jgi:hypothetical protein
VLECVIINVSLSAFGRCVYRLGKRYCRKKKNQESKFCHVLKMHFEAVSTIRVQRAGLYAGWELAFRLPTTAAD